MERVCICGKVFCSKKYKHCNFCRTRGQERKQRLLIEVKNYLRENYNYKILDVKKKFRLTLPETFDLLKEAI